ncbi:MAG: WD40/YVTN/BNR-like repeat-containing protein [Planctomycetota bacterium]
MSASPYVRVGSVCCIVVTVFAGLFLWRHPHAAPQARPKGPAVNDTLRAAATMEGARAATTRFGANWKAERINPPFKPLEAAKFFLDQRLAPGETELPLEHLRTQLADVLLREQQVALRGGAAPGGVLGWTWLGPGNVGGRTRTIVIDPNSPNIMYAAGVAGGVWKSTDAGASWNETDDTMLNLAVTTIAMDPTNSSILYAGTGEGFFNSVFVRGLGIFKSTDAGANWTQLSGTVTGVPTGAFYYVNKIVISPNDPSRIYAGTRTGVWRSLDAGQAWSPVLGNPFYITAPNSSNGSAAGCTDLAVRSDRNPDVLFAVFGSQQADGFFRSQDGGDTWLTYSVPANQGRMTIALAPSNNDVLYLLMADNGSGGAYGQLVNVFRTTDGADSFESRVDFDHPFGPWLLSNLVLATGCVVHPIGVYSQGWYDNIVKVDPLDPDIVWVGGVDIFRSGDGAQTFGAAGYSYYYDTEPEYIHADHHMIVFHPDFNGTSNQTVYVGNDGGLWKTTNGRAAASQEDCPLFCEEPDCRPIPDIQWTSVNNNYGVTQFYHGDSAKERDVFVGGCQDNGTNRGQAVNTPNEWTEIFGGDGGYVAIDPTNGDRMFVEGTLFPSIQISTDGGDTFDAATNGITDNDGVFITPFAMDQANPDVLWTGGSRPWRTTNGGALWEVVGPNFAGANQISAIAIAPSDSSIVYLGFNNGYVVRSTNALDPNPNWQIFSNGLIGSWVSSVAVDPNDPDTAYCTYSNYGLSSNILRSTNGGLNWSSIDGISFSGVPDIPVHWLAVRPCNSQQIYVGTELGVFASDDGGATWDPANSGLANTVVESLDFKNSHTLVAFTHGRGVFMTDLEPCASCFTRNGDMDGDGDVAADDYGLFAGCIGGPGDSTPPNFCDPCDFSNADLDADADVDLNDFALFALVFGN